MIEKEFVPYEEALALKELGFDVLYLPPIHPIGSSFRKGKNNSVLCEEGEPGVPYGIGSVLGGHTAIHEELGTLSDFKDEGLVAINGSKITIINPFFQSEESGSAGFPSWECYFDLPIPVFPSAGH